MHSYLLNILITFLLAVLKVVCLLVAIAYFTLAERKIMASVQRRVGPNVVGPFGLLQPLADGLKLAGKELAIPAQASSRIFLTVAISVLLFALSGWAAMPFGLFDHSEQFTTSTFVKVLALTEYSFPVESSWKLDVTAPDPGVLLNQNSVCVKYRRCSSLPFPEGYVRAWSKGGPKDPLYAFPQSERYLIYVEWITWITKNYPSYFHNYNNCFCSSQGEQDVLAAICDKRNELTMDTYNRLVSWGCEPGMPLYEPCDPISRECRKFDEFHASRCAEFAKAEAAKPDVYGL